VAVSTVLVWPSESSDPKPEDHVPLLQEQLPTETDATTTAIPDETAQTVSSSQVDATEASSSLPDVTQPMTSQPEATEPEATEPKETKPEKIMPEKSEPKPTKPSPTEPADAKPEPTVPKATEPVPKEPETTVQPETQPVATEPEYIPPQTIQPEMTETVVTEPEVTEPETTEPEATEPVKPERQEPKAMDFTVYDTEGNPVKLSSYIGKPIVLNFWASWCGPCKREMPGFQQLYQELGDQVQFLMVNLTGYDDIASANALIAQYGYTFPVLFDTVLDGADTYGVTAFPTTVFIDGEGYLMEKYVGAMDEGTLKNKIDLIR
jgi:thiol-disulfide isomerase/thioredoxin